MSPLFNRVFLEYHYCVVVRLVHTGLGSSYLIAHVLHYPPPPRAQLCIKYCSNKQQQPCVVVRPVHTSLCSLYLIAHVSHCHPPPTHSFELGTTVINNNNLNYSQKRVSTTLIMNSATTIVLHSRGQSRYHHSVLCSSSMTWQRKTSRSLNQDT